MTTSKKGSASKPGSRTRMAPKRTAPTQLLDLFLPFGIPPSSLHVAVQNAAIEAGWIPPWEREDQEIQKKQAGKKSGASRAALAELRRYLVREAHAQLKPAHRLHPSSNDSIDALHKKYRDLLAPDAKNLDGLAPLILTALSGADQKTLRKMKRGTLIKDLRRLGIKSRRKARQTR
jgi:hypothetical protein